VVAFLRFFDHKCKKTSPTTFLNCAKIIKRLEVDLLRGIVTKRSKIKAALVGLFSGTLISVGVQLQFNGVSDHDWIHIFLGSSLVSFGGMIPVFVNLFSKRNSS
jgi:hypothetical protein